MSENHSQFTEHVTIPMAQSAVSGLLTGVITTAGAIALHLGEPFAIGSALAGVATLVSWTHYRGEAADRLNPVKPAPPAEPVRQFEAQAKTIRLSIDWDSGRSGLFDDIHVDDTTFIRWACEVANGKSLGENHHTGVTGGFSKGQYHTFLYRMIFHGLVRQKSRSKNVGYMLTRKGEAICRAILDKYGADYIQPSPISKPLGHLD